MASTFGLSTLFCFLILWTTTALGQSAPRRVEAAQSHDSVGGSDVYFLAIGSQDYAAGGQIGTQSTVGFESPAAPVNSATRVAAGLAHVGARAGILLTSEPRHFVSRADILQALVALKYRIRQDAPKNPILVFYYMGHGLGDPFNHYLFLIPGNVVVDVSHDANQTNTAVLLKEAVWNFDILTSLFMFNTLAARKPLDDFFITEIMPDPRIAGFSASDPPRVTLGKLALSWAAEGLRIHEEIAELEARDAESSRSQTSAEVRAHRVPFVAMFDDCYGDVTQDIIGAQARIGRGGILDAIAPLATTYFRDQISEIEDGGVVLYATNPGTAMGDFDDPGPLPPRASMENGPPRVGPLARRLLSLVAQPGLSRRMTIGGFRQAIELPNLGSFADGATVPIPYDISQTKADFLSRPFLFWAPGPKPASVEKRIGTGTSPEICCGPGR